MLHPPKKTARRFRVGGPISLGFGAHVSGQPRTDQVELFAQTAPMFPEGLTLSCQN